MDISIELQKDFKDMSPALQRGLEAGLLAAAQSIQARAKTLCAVNYGKLRQSITVKVEKEKKEAIVGTNMQYASHVEYGTGAHKTMMGHQEFVDQITEWGQKHGFNTIGSLMFLMMIIRKRGTKAHPFLRPAVDTGRADASKVFMAQIHKALAEGVK